MTTRRTTTALAALLLCALLPALPAAAAAEPRQVTLEQAYRLALQNNPTVGILRQRVKQAEAARYKAWTPLKPTVYAQPTFQIYDREITIPGSMLATGEGPTPPDIVFQKKYQWGFVATAKLPLFMGPAYPALQAAYKQVEAARLDADNSRRGFLLRVANAYYATVSQRHLIRSLERKVAVDQRHLAASKAKKEVGTAPRSTVMRAELELTQDQQQLKVAQITQLANQRQLALLLGLEGLVRAAAPPEPAPVKGTVEQLTRRALGERLDVRGAKLTTEIARKGREAVWWGFLPTLDLNWTYRWTQAAGLIGDQDTWFFLFQLNIPIYDGGSRYAELRRTASQVRQAELAEALLEDEVSSEIVKLRSQVLAAESSVVSAQKAVELARTTAGDLQASFEAGAVSQLETLDANQRALEAEIQLTAARYQRDMARLALSHALGTFDPLADRSKK